MIFASALKTLRSPSAKTSEYGGTASCSGGVFDCHITQRLAESCKTSLPSGPNPRVGDDEEFSSSKSGEDLHIQCSSCLSSKPLRSTFTEIWVESHNTRVPWCSVSPLFKTTIGSHIRDGVNAQRTLRLLRNFGSAAHHSAKSARKTVCPASHRSACRKQKFLEKAN